MLRHIFSTFVSKVLSAAINFGVIILTTQFLGPDGRGQISLFVADIALVILTAQLVGGPALVYLAARHRPFALAVVSYAFALLAGVVGPSVLVLLGQVPPGLEVHLFTLAVLESLHAVQTVFLLGWDLPRRNRIQLVRSVLQMATLLLLFYFQTPAVMHYVWAFYVGSGWVMVASGRAVWPRLRPFTLRRLPVVARLVVRMGSQAQVSNIIQFLNFRLSYYFLNAFVDVGAVGLYSTGVMLAESIWVVSQSIGTVQYSVLTQQRDRDYAVRVSGQMAKLSGWVCLVAVGGLLLLPPSLLRLVFGPEFGDLGGVINTLAPGVLAHGVTVPLNHYFSSRGRYGVNIRISLVGLAVTLVACGVLIPTLGATGAGLAASAAYVAMMVYVLYRFRRDNGFRLHQLLPTAADARALRGGLRRLLRR
ncbi:MAG: polysaccharide biosynthesis C-terminal domain-containing protein [Catalinimonas sp.]